MIVPALFLLEIAFACQNNQQVKTRKEWRELSSQQQKSFLDAVSCLKKAPSKSANIASGSRSRFDDIAYVHSKAASIGSVNDPGIAHGGTWFLPWHRMFLQMFENILVDECGYNDALPYWDWSQDSANFIGAPVWGDNNFGSNGSGEGSCVKDGPFAGFSTTFGPATCITRDIVRSDSQISKTAVAFLISSNSKSFVKFSDSLESTLHGQVHCDVGGSMCDINQSANDPIFFLHHANVDRIWWMWQQTYPSLASKYDAQGSTSKFSTFGIGYKDSMQFSQLWDTKGSKSDLCYVYSNKGKPSSSSSGQSSSSVQISVMSKSLSSPSVQPSSAPPAQSSLAPISSSSSSPAQSSSSLSGQRSSQSPSPSPTLPPPPPPTGECFPKANQWNRQMGNNQMQAKRQAFASIMCQFLNYANSQQQNGGGVDPNFLSQLVTNGDFQGLASLGNFPQFFGALSAGNITAGSNGGGIQVSQTTEQIQEVLPFNSDGLIFDPSSEKDSSSSLSNFMSSCSIMALGCGLLLNFLLI